ncbi:MAG: hypothetical protein QM844_17420, partial [Planctomycetota bacterium]|nr:hypothetical protein [Planctomycetota bacterium]
MVVFTRNAFGPDARLSGEPLQYSLPSLPRQQNASHVLHADSIGPPQHPETVLLAGASRAAQLADFFDPDRLDVELGALAEIAGG